MNAGPKMAIIYSDLIEIRFSDLDFYNHVNSKHYLDFVSTSRLNFLSKEIKMPIEEVTARNIGFYMTKSTINYKRPIKGLQKIRANSHVSEVKDNKLLIIPFDICSEDSSKTFSDGVLEFAVIDLQSNRTTQTPAWILDLFFK